MIKNLFKKIFIQIARFLDYEIIDQNKFVSPTLNTSLNENISKTTKEMISAGASGIHIEDQVSEKRCGHRPNKEIVSNKN